MRIRVFSITANTPVHVSLVSRACRTMLAMVPGRTPVARTRRTPPFRGQAPVDGELPEVRIGRQDDPSVRRRTTKDFPVGGSRLGRLDPLNVVTDISKGGHDGSRNVLVNQQAHYAS